MLTRWVCGIALLTCTILVQLAVQALLVHGTVARLARQLGGGTTKARLLESLFTVFVLMLGHLAQVALWAALYAALGDLHGYADAAYFSLASYTTIGAAELELSPAHRILGAVESAVGVLMFGWSTALLAVVVLRSEDSANAPQSDLLHHRNLSERELH
jgi:voltage-gated potassium channel Kch